MERSLFLPDEESRAIAHAVVIDWMQKHEEEHLPWKMLEGQNIWQLPHKQLHKDYAEGIHAVSQSVFQQVIAICEQDSDVTLLAIENGKFYSGNFTEADIGRFTFEDILAELGARESFAKHQGFGNQLVKNLQDQIRHVFPRIIIPSRQRNRPRPEHIKL